MNTNENKNPKTNKSRNEAQAMDRWFANLSPEEVEFARRLWEKLKEADRKHLIKVGKGRNRFRARLTYLLNLLGAAPEWQWN